jgi:hypothetical protein
MKTSFGSTAAGAGCTSFISRPISTVAEREDCSRAPQRSEAGLFEKGDCFQGSGNQFQQNNVSKRSNQFLDPNSRPAGECIHICSFHSSINEGLHPLSSIAAIRLRHRDRDCGSERRIAGTPIAKGPFANCAISRIARGNSVSFESVPDMTHSTNQWQ